MSADAARRRGNRMAAARVAGDFASGWARLPHPCVLPFYAFAVDDSDRVVATALCGRVYRGARGSTLFHAGNFPRCKRCIAAWPGHESLMSKNAHGR